MRMTAEDINSLYLAYQLDDCSLPSPSEAQFTLPSTLCGGAENEDGQQQPRRRPRGGRKPLRSREQQLHELEAALEQKLREFKAAQDERDMLQQRIKVLEVVLPIREQQVQLLKQKRQAAEGWQATQFCADDALHTNAVHITELRASASSGGLSSGSESQPAGGCAVNFGEKLASGTCQRPAALTRTIQGHMDYAKVMKHAEKYTSGRIALFTALPAHNRVPPHVLRQLSSLWKHWVREAGLVLHAYDARPHDSGPQLKLAELYERLAPTFRALRMDHPFLMTEIMYINFETGARDEPPPESFWVNVSVQCEVPVAEGLRFNPQQLVDAKAALALYKERTEKVLEERHTLAAQLDAHLAAFYGRPAWQRPRDCPLVCGELMLEVDEMAVRLYRNVMFEFNALELITDFMSSNLFSLVQTVRGSVLSYPYFPDAVAILNCLAATSPCPEK